MKKTRMKDIASRKNEREREGYGKRNKSGTCA